MPDHFTAQQAGFNTVAIIERMETGISEPSVATQPRDSKIDINKHGGA